MKPLVSNNICALVPYIPGRPAAQREKELGLKYAVKLESNENPFGPSPLALAAARAACIDMHRYPDDRAHALRQRLAVLHAVSADEIVLGHGSNELIDLIARTFVTQQEHAVVGVPSFSCYALSLAAANIPTTQVPLRARLFWDLRSVRAAVRDDTKLVFLDHPGNPTSTHIPAPELRAFIRDLPQDIIVVVDEAYGEFADAADYASALSMRAERERLIVLRTLSKAYGLAGLRLGYAISSAEVADYLGRVRVPFNVNSVAQAAAEAAVDDQAHMLQGIAHNARERVRVTRALEGMGLRVAPSQTNFLCVCVARPAGIVHDALQRAGVFVRPFGPPLHHHLRIGIGLARENDRLLEVLPRVLDRLSRDASLDSVEPSP